MRPFYFITGSLGSLGREVVPRILTREPSTQIVLLVRAGDDAEVRDRMDGLGRYLDLYWPCVDRARLQACRGDVTEFRFGLPEDAYRDLAARVTHIIHAAACIDLGQPLAAARRIHVNGVRELLRLADRCPRLVHLGHVSTAFVAGDREGIVLERHLRCGQGFRNAYEESKCEAEETVQGRMGELPITVFRPSIIVGDAHDGRTCNFATFYRALRMIARGVDSRIPADPDARLDIVTVDYVADAMSELMIRPRRRGAVYHLIAGTARSVRIADLVASARSCVPRTEVVEGTAAETPRTGLSNLLRLPGPEGNRSTTRRPGSISGRVVPARAPGNLICRGCSHSVLATDWGRVAPLGGTAMATRSLIAAGGRADPRAAGLRTTSLRTVLGGPPHGRRGPPAGARKALLVVTSGGCTALNLALEGPDKVIAVDLNAAQSWLLHLKIAGARVLGTGNTSSCSGRTLDPAPGPLLPLPPGPAGARPCLLGLAKTIASMPALLDSGRYERYLAKFRALLRTIHGEKRIARLFEPRDLDGQRRFYEDEWDSTAWRLFFRVFFSRTILGFAGLDRAFFTYVEGIPDFGAHFLGRARHVLTELPIRDNYFLAQICLGRYLDELSLPPYLQPASFERLRTAVRRIEVVTEELGTLLARLPDESVDGFAYSNVFEWVSLEAFESLLRQTHRASRPGARLCYRNLLVRRKHLPALDDLFVPDDGLAARLLHEDRSFVYSHFEIATVRKPATAGAGRATGANQGGAR